MELALLRNKLLEPGDTVLRTSVGPQCEHQVSDVEQADGDRIDRARRLLARHSLDDERQGTRVEFWQVQLILRRAHQVARQLAPRIGRDADDGGTHMKRAGDRFVFPVRLVVLVGAITGDQQDLVPARS